MGVDYMLDKAVLMQMMIVIKWEIVFGDKVIGK